MCDEDDLDDASTGLLIRPWFKHCQGSPDELAAFRLTSEDAFKTLAAGQYEKTVKAQTQLDNVKTEDASADVLAAAPKRRRVSAAKMALPVIPLAPGAVKNEDGEQHSHEATA